MITKTAKLRITRGAIKRWTETYYAIADECWRDATNCWHLPASCQHRPERWAIGGYINGLRKQLSELEAAA